VTVRRAENGRRRLRRTALAYTLTAMHSLSNERRQASRLRRRQVRRRRIVAIGLVVPLVIGAIWAAYAWPAPKPARVPDPAVISQFHQSSSVDRRVVVAKLEGIDLLLPVKLEASTAVAFHPVDNPNSVALSPVGQPGDASSVSSTLGDIFSTGGGMRYYTMGGDGSDASSRTGGLDVGAVPGAFVYSPVDGRVVSVKVYQLLGRYDDTEIEIQLADDPSLLLVVTHIAGAQVKIGATVSAGETALGSVRGFPATLQQQLHQFTTDAGDHVQLVAVRVPTQLSGF
jgi:hypothetical protein